ncbi:SMC-Scp complex subunit ScpB [Patescibacteria group bacterium]|nr:SMC-Scp complex subunit ScpB [Patescibacteria group bacterium]
MSKETEVSQVKAKLESLLLAAGKAVNQKRLAEILKITVADIAVAVQELQKDYLERSTGFRLLLNGSEVALVTNPDYAALVMELVQQEEMGELTRPQLEALSVIAYRGPISKAELEQIRGVNCSLILRNLQIRGLVQETGSAGELSRYQVTMDFLRHLGLGSNLELPNYQELSSHEILQQFTAQNSSAQ